MNDEALVELRGVAKKYCRTLRRSMLYGLADVARDLVGLSVPSAELRPDEFWALRDIDLRLQRGQCLGVIGGNGAGKSTLLKMIAGVFHPDLGQITVRGRVGSLIEVGAGFHPMLTGRENIYVKGAILGMRKREIDRRFDEIVEFAGLKQALDVPVKHYSSGMHVRLGFAVAAHTDPDVLLIDEALAVGDLSFTAKCLRYLSQMKQRCVMLLVAHEMRHIARMCDTVLYLRGGGPAFIGPADAAIGRFRRDVAGGFELPQKAHTNGDVTIRECLIEDESPTVRQFDDVTIRIEARLRSRRPMPVFNVAVYRADGVHCFGVVSSTHGRDVGPGRICASVRLPSLRLMSGTYVISAYVFDHATTGLLAFHENALTLHVSGSEMTRGVYAPEHDWTMEESSCGGAEAS